MKQKTILDQDILYKDGKEIKLSIMQIKILRILQDNLLHRHAELIDKVGIKRSWLEKDTLRNHMTRLNKRTKLHIKPLKGLGFYLEDRIFVNK